MPDWKGVIAVEGEVSSDGRLLRPGALTWETPLPLYAPTEDDPWSRPIIGTVQHIARVIGEDGRNLIYASGVSWSPWPADLGPCVSSVNGEYDTQMGEGGRLIFTAAEIKGVYFGKPIWPDVTIEEES
jgi:hypothetical protein